MIAPSCCCLLKLSLLPVEFTFVCITGKISPVFCDCITGIVVCVLSFFADSFQLGMPLFTKPTLLLIVTKDLFLASSFGHTIRKNFGPKYIIIAADVSRLSKMPLKGKKRSGEIF